MLTIEDLKKLGADTEDGLKRCLGKEDFYLRMVGLALADEGYEKMKEAIEAGNLDEAFEKAHSLKGILSNVSLTSLADPVIRITEDLRARKEMDYGPVIDEIFSVLEKFRALV